MVHSDEIIGSLEAFNMASSIEKFNKQRIESFESGRDL